MIIDELYANLKLDNCKGHLNDTDTLEIIFLYAFTQVYRQKIPPLGKPIECSMSSIINDTRSSIKINSIRPKSNFKIEIKNIKARKIKNCSRCSPLLHPASLVARTFSSDIIRAVFSYLPLPSLVTASEVDRHWRQESMAPKLWKVLLLRHFGSSFMPIIEAMSSAEPEGLTNMGHGSSCRALTENASHFSPTASSFPLHPSSYQRLFAKHYKNVRGICSEDVPELKDVGKEEARWHRRFERSFLHIHVWGVENAGEGKQEGEKKEQLVASALVPLTDGEALTALFGSWGLSLTVEKKDGGPLDPSTYKSTVTFLKLSDDAEGVATAQALVSSEYEEFDDWEGDMEESSRLFVPAQCTGEEHMDPYDVLQLNSYLQYEVRLLVNEQAVKATEGSTVADPQRVGTPSLQAWIYVIRFDDSFQCECGACERPALEFEDKFVIWRHLAACLEGVAAWK